MRVMSFFSEISALIKETPKAPLPLPPCENTERIDIHEQEAGSH